MAIGQLALRLDSHSVQLPASEGQFAGDCDLFRATRCGRAVSVQGGLRWAVNVDLARYGAPTLGDSLGGEDAVCRSSVF